MVSQKTNEKEIANDTKTTAKKGLKSESVEEKSKENKIKVSKRMLKVNFTGRELLNETVFDTTIENVAKENNVYNKEKEYGALAIILGEKELLEKIEKELATMKVGEEKTIHLNEKEGFGERKPDLVRVVPLKVFHNEKINPVPGLVINVGNALGKVQSVSGGRVRVDFNHPLAGRELEYVVKLEKEVVAGKEMCESFFEKYYSQIPKVEKEIKETNLYITLPSSVLKGIERVNATIIKLGKDLGINIEIKKAKEEKKEIVKEAKEQEKKETKKEEKEE